MEKMASSSRKTTSSTKTKIKNPSIDILSTCTTTKTKTNTNTKKLGIPDTGGCASIPRKGHCAHCNKQFNSSLRSTRKFIVAAPPAGAGTNKPNQSTIHVWEGILEIQNWRIGTYLKNYEESEKLVLQLQRAKANISKDIALCSNCGILIAKLYSTIKCLIGTEEQAQGYLAQFTKKYYSVELIGDEDQSPGPGHQHDADGDGMNFGSHDSEPDFRDSADDGIRDESNAPGEPIPGYTLFQDEPPLEPPPLPQSIKQFGTGDDWDEEVEAAAQTKEFLCFQCGKGFHKQTNLTRHLLLTHDIGDRPKYYVCDECGKSYYFAYQLKDHMFVHTDDRPFHCPVEGCDQKFKHKKDWFQHKRYRHSEDSKKFQCRYCWKSFKEKRSWRWHEEYVHRIPKGTKHFKCAHCEKSFHRQRTQIEHSRKCTRNPSYIQPPKTEVPQVPGATVSPEESQSTSAQNFPDLNSLVEVSVEKYFEKRSKK